MADPSEPYVRRSKPRGEETLLTYATTPGGAVRIKRAYRQAKRMSRDNDVKRR